MKPTISVKSGGYTVPTSAPPLFPSSASQHPIPVEMTPIPPPANTLLDIEFPLFEEATQTAARFLKIPICFVGIMAPDALVLKAAVGLSQLGLMNPLARTRRLPLQDSLATAVWQTRRSLVLPTIEDQTPFAESYLVQEYGIRCYMGVPLLTSEGTCLGLLAAMDTAPREFSAEAIAMMELLARWSVSEYERSALAAALSANTVAAPSPIAVAPPTTAIAGEAQLLDTVRLTLMSQLTQDMRSPLTTITGMANMLSREIYGTLTPKQREYADIVRNSSQHLLEIANEVLDLSSLAPHIQPLQPTSADVDMIGQHVQRMLAPLAEKNNQEIRLTVEPGLRLWTLDRDLVRQALYHLLFSIIQMAGEGGIIRGHSTERDNRLNITLWMSHPWLGEGLPSIMATLYESLGTAAQEAEVLALLLTQEAGSPDPTAAGADPEADWPLKQETLQARETLSLLLSRHLIEHHGGTLTLQGGAESGYRFLIVLP